MHVFSSANFSALRMLSFQNEFHQIFRKIGRLRSLCCCIVSAGRTIKFIGQKWLNQGLYASGEFKTNS